MKHSRDTSVPIASSPCNYISIFFHSLKFIWILILGFEFVFSLNWRGMDIDYSYKIQSKNFYM